MLSANSYMFRHQGAILSAFNNNKASLSPTRNAGTSRPHFPH